MNSLGKKKKIKLLKYIFDLDLMILSFGESNFQLISFKYTSFISPALD